MPSIYISMYGVRSSLGIVASFFQHITAGTRRFATEAKRFLKIPVLPFRRVSDPYTWRVHHRFRQADFRRHGTPPCGSPQLVGESAAGAAMMCHCASDVPEGCTASTPYQAFPFIVVSRAQAVRAVVISRAPAVKSFILCGQRSRGWEKAAEAALPGAPGRTV